MHTQSGVSCLPLLLSSLNQIPGTGLKNLNENPPLTPLPHLTPLKFCPFQLTVAVVALLASNRYNTPTLSVLHTPFIQYCVWPLLHLLGVTPVARADTVGPFFACALTLGRGGGGDFVLNPEIVYMCKSDKNPPPNTFNPAHVCLCLVAPGPHWKLDNGSV